MDITGNQTVRLRMPVATASEIDGSKKKGVFAFSTTDQTVAVCPEDGANFVRMGIHPADAPAATSLGGGDIVLIVQGGVLKRTTVSEIGGGGIWQPLDSDLTAIAALTTASFGRSLLTLADAPSARSAIGAASSADLSGYQPLDSDLTAIAALTTTPFGRSLLALADGPAVRTAIGAGPVQPSDLSAYQPLDSDLTAIAALTTTSFGRSLLTVADAAAARSAIGAGTSSFSGAYSALSSIPASIDAIDGLTPAADRLPYYTGASTGALATLTAFARTLLDDADAPTARTTLGAGTSNLALGETPSTAYRGDRGKTAYDHSQATGNPHSTTAADVGAMAKITLSGSVDFNSINGGAPCVAVGDGASYANAPYLATQLVGYGGTLIQGVGASGSITQIWCDVRTGTIYYRGKVGPTWGTWASIHDSYNMPSGATGKAVFAAANAATARAAIGAAKAPSKVDVSASTTLGAIDASAIKVTATDVILTLSGGVDGQGWDIINPTASTGIAIPSGATLWKSIGFDVGPTTIALGGGRPVRIARIDATTWTMLWSP